MQRSPPPSHSTPIACLAHSEQDATAVAAAAADPNVLQYENTRRKQTIKYVMYEINLVVFPKIIALVHGDDARGFFSRVINPNAPVSPSSYNNNNNNIHISYLRRTRAPVVRRPCACTYTEPRSGIFLVDVFKTLPNANAVRAYNERRGDGVTIILQYRKTSRKTQRFNRCVVHSLFSDRFRWFFFFFFVSGLLK